MWMRLDTYLIMFLCSFNLLGPGVLRNNDFGQDFTARNIMPLAPLIGAK